MVESAICPLAGSGESLYPRFLSAVVLLLSGLRSKASNRNLPTMRASHTSLPRASASNGLPDSGAWRPPPTKSLPIISTILGRRDVERRTLRSLLHRSCIRRRSKPLGTSADAAVFEEEGRHKRQQLRRSPSLFDEEHHSGAGISSESLLRRSEDAVIPV